MITLPGAVEVFRLDDNCEGVIWHDAAGWQGCLKWDIAGNTDNTDVVGPFFARLAAIQRVKAAFVARLGAVGHLESLESLESRAAVRRTRD